MMPKKTLSDFFYPKIPLSPWHESKYVHLSGKFIQNEYNQARTTKIGLLEGGGKSEII